MRMPKWRIKLKILSLLVGSLLLFYAVTLYTNDSRSPGQSMGEQWASKDHVTLSEIRRTPSFHLSQELIKQSHNGANLQLDIFQRNTSESESVMVSRAVGSTVIQFNEPCLYQSKDSRSSTWRRSNGRWFNYTMTKSLSFYAYSALYDDRESLLSDPVIRIVAISFRYDERLHENKTVPQLYCAFYYAEDDAIRYVSMTQEPKRIGGGWTLLGEPVKEYIYTCPLIKPSRAGSGNKWIPSALTVVDQPGNALVSACMPVEVPQRAQHVEDFIVCVQVAYGTINPYSLVEWLEIQKILGVSHVSIYNLSMNGVDSGRVLNHYINEGFVDIRQTSFIDPLGADRNHEEYLLHGSPVINDCAYRNMHRYTYVIVIDFDELLMPREHFTLQNLVTFLKQQYPPDNPQAFYVFYNQYYFVDMPPDIKESPFLTFLRHRRRVAVSPYGYAVKSIVNLQGCIQLHNHWCWGVTPAFEASKHPTVIDSKIAVLQHYKACHFNKEECDKMMSDKNITLDQDVGGVWRFRDSLRNNVAGKIKEILGHNL